MAHGRVERARVGDREERVLLVLANVLPLVAYASGSLLFLEALLLYLLEPPIVAVAIALRLLVVDDPASADSRRLLAIGPDWLVRPVAITTWNLARAAKHAGTYLLAFAFVYGLLVVLFLSLVDAAASLPGFDALPLASVVLVALGFAQRPLRDLGQFLWTRGERRADPDALCSWSRLEVHRLLVLSVCFGVFGTAATTLLEQYPALALVAFAAVKTAVDLLYQPRVGPTV